MSKEEILKIQTSVLKVNIHCDGCERKVKKILQKIDGVYKVNIDAEQGKVTVSGNVGPDTLIQKLTKNGKYAELWGAPNTNNNNQSQQLVDQLKDLKIEKGSKSGKQQNNKGQGQKGGAGGGNNQPPKAGGANNKLPQQLQNKAKGFQDMKPPIKGLNVPFDNKGGQNQKSVKFEEKDDGFDDVEDDYSGDDYDDNFDGEVDDAPVNKMKTPVVMGNNGLGGGQMPNVMKNDAQMAGILKNHQTMLMKGVNGGGGDGKGKACGSNGGNVPGGAKCGGKKGGNRGNPNQSGGGGQKGGKKGGGQPQGGKNGGDGGGGQKKNANGGGASLMNAAGAQKGGQINAGLPGIPNMMPGMSAGGVSIGGPKGNIPMNHNMSRMGQFPPVQGLPAGAAAAINGGSGGVGGGYYQGAGPEAMANPYYQQQMAAMMNQQRAVAGDERFEPMITARPPPEFNYAAPYHPYGPYAPPSYNDPYSNYSNDENSSGCNVM